MKIFAARDHDLGGGFFVKRVLPFREKRMVGPFIFLDEMGPVTIQPKQNTDVRPHPHIGLSTLTYLFEGRGMHRDSLGTVASIEPGEVNWMTAGKGISHSERAHESEKNQTRKMHGLQFWVALPDDAEDCDPSFQHYKKSQIPALDNNEMRLDLIAGQSFGMTSPVVTSSPLLLANVQLKKDVELMIPAGTYEIAVYMIGGESTVNGNQIAQKTMACGDIGENLKVSAPAGAHFVVMGGTPFSTPRKIWWNLVSTSQEKIERAKQAWRDRSFPQVPGETEFIPLPDENG